MRGFTCAVLMVMVFAAGAYAEMKEQTGRQPQDQPPGQQMPMDCPMMGGQGMMGGGTKQGMMGGGMMGHHMMMHDTAELMTGILSIQEKIVSGVGPSEKEALLKEIARLKSKVAEVHRTCCMMGTGQQQSGEGTGPQKEPSHHAH